MKHNLGSGATADLSLRVSVTTLMRVIFIHPGNGELMLALERKATLRGDKVEVKSQPFGGATHILNVDADPASEALGFYKRMGMTVITRQVAYEKTLREGENNKD